MGSSHTPKAGLGTKATRNCLIAKLNRHKVTKTSKIRGRGRPSTPNPSNKANNKLRSYNESILMYLTRLGYKRHYLLSQLRNQSSYISSLYRR